jgi:hypothetical protein
MCNQEIMFLFGKACISFGIMWFLLALSGEYWSCLAVHRRVRRVVAVKGTQFFSNTSCCAQHDGNFIIEAVCVKINFPLGPAPLPL